MCGLLAVGRVAAPVPPDQARIDAVREGREKTAVASWWGFDPEDSTAALQAALDSEAPKVVVDDPGVPWIVRGMSLPGDKEIVFAKGVVVEAKRGEFRGGGDCLFVARLKENLTLSGYGATFRMHKADYQGPEYTKAEWRHTLSLLSCHSVKVLGLTLAESGGDGIYLGVAKQGVPCSDIVIRDVLCDKNHRQGISVISAENLLIENTVMRETSGTPPMAGIDFEPNEASERIAKCVMRNCSVEGNAGDGYDFYLPALKATSEPVSVRLENCRSVGNNRALAFTTGNSEETAVPGSAEFVGCTFEDARGPGVVLAGVPAAVWRMRFSDCQVVRCGVDKAPAPIVLIAGADCSRPVGGLAFDGCLIVDPIDRQPLVYQDWAGGMPAVDITGTLILERDGARTDIPLTEELLDKWLPSRKLKPIPPWDDTDVTYRPLHDPWDPAKLAGSARQRGDVSMLLYARAGDTVSLTIRSLQVGQYAGQAMAVDVVAPSGAATRLGEVPFTQEATLEFAATEEGVHRVQYKPGANAAQVLRASHPLGLTAGRAALPLYTTTGDFFLFVPADVTEFGVKVFGEGGEGVKAALYDAAGNLSGEQDNIIEPHQFVVNRAATQQGEVWRLRVDRASTAFLEDYRVQLLGVPPVLAMSEEGLLVPQVR
jgi:hypothetical protein